ncbi:protein NRT1/ PTR FAMILY 5.5-like isoform X2 [Salvia divinorum]|uniref:Protein NRT1/ PTR FAMILY 5.5-like isoform X2 n=1 Tax=Salvia divinorum TaxID=28513 RepID=A0ABD1GYC4_SALDI
MGSYVRISALLWSDILVYYALFVMQNYLTKVWKISFVNAAGILNIWGGISMILPVFFLFLVDTLLGNRKMLLISSISYSLGIGLVTMSTPPFLADATGTCKDYSPKCIHRPQKVLFYIGMALIAVGGAGNFISVKPFLDEQRVENEHDSNEGAREFCKLPFFIVVVIVPIVGAVALPFVKPWSLRFGIPAIFTAAAALLFLSGVFLRGSLAYKEVQPQGSPITSVCRVFFAAACKISQPFPDDDRYLYKESGKENDGFSHTRILRCLEKAAIILPNENPETANKGWGLCSISEVEDAKIAVRMFPMCTTFIVCGIVSSFGNTYFIEQANRMNRRVGNWKVPLQVLLLLSQWAKSFLFTSRAKCLIKKYGKHGPPMGIAVAMIFSILCCITAAKMELHRLKVIEKHGLLEKPDNNIPMSVFLLLFQFVLLAGLDTFFEMSVTEFYKDQSPKCMVKYLSCFARGVSGLGFMSGVLSVYVVGKLSEAWGNKSWFQSTLNKSRLDRYYWVLAGLSTVNLVVFMFVACSYRYKTPDGPGRNVDRPARGVTALPPDENGSNQCFNLFG